MRLVGTRASAKASNYSLFASVIFIVFTWTANLGWIRIVSVQCSQIIILILGACSYIYTYLKKKDKQYNEYVLFVLSYSVFGLLSYIYNGNLDALELLWPIGYMGIALALIANNINDKWMRLSFYFSCTFYVLYILSNNILSLSFDRIASSRNTVSANLLVSLSLYIISRSKKNRGVSLIPFVVYMICCVVGYGRTGIIDSILMLALCLLAPFSADKPSGMRSNLKYRIIFFATTAIGLAILLKYFSISIWLVEDSFAARGLRTSRTIIWESYYNVVKSSFLNILLGAPVDKMAFSAFGANLHNSYLAIHAKYGLVMFVFVLYRTILRLVRLRSNKENMLFVTFLGVIVRISFDGISFNGVMDVVLMYFLFSKEKTDSNHSIISYSNSRRDANGTM